MFKAFPAVIGCIGLMASFSTLAEAKLESQKDKASYTIGIQMGMQLSQQKDNLLIEKRNLLIEEHTLDEHSRIRRIARKKLSMSQPTKENSVLVELP